MLILFLCNPLTRLAAQKNQLDTSQIDAKKLTRSKHHATTHSRRTVIFFQKRGTPFFADRPPGSSYRPRQVESKGAAGISRQPITLRFVGYPTFPVGCAGFIVAYRLHTHNKKTCQPSWATSATASVAVRAVFRRFLRNASTHYIVSGALLARFLFFREGG